ncbi:superoxide dismutase [Pelagibius litoralis]|uniref:Superoxide dismutase n=1 Tax=Pelagibius litoralis TaxID=374515 RepID=A0A967C547_9PROT|nr:superoxide dismutase [Pelagibius litoralis]NIA67556.1 superoxide dismutase [Pelagibius litoralis]
MAFELPALPFAPDALEPHYSANTLSFHHGKHHQAYVTKLNELIAGSADEEKTLEEIIASSTGGLFNQAAQVWNHTFFWNSMTPGGGGSPSGALADAISAAFGSLEAFNEQFKAAGVGQFGSGWVWLVKDDGALKIVTTANAETPLTNGQVPVLTCDVWEHAYYLDYQNRRPDFIQSFLDNLVNWDFAAANYEEVSSAAAE